VALWKERGGWRFKFQYRGRKYRGGIYPTRAEALAAQEEKKKSVRAFHPQTPTDITFRQVASLYLDWSQRRHAKKTHEYKAMVFRRFIEFHGDLPITEITPLQIQSYLNSRPSNHNFNVHRKELYALFSWAGKMLRREIGISLANPCRDVERLPESRAEKLIPTKEEIQKLLAAAGGDEKPLLLVLIHTLARIDEVLRLRWDDIDFQKKTVRLWTRKLLDGSWVYDYIPMNRELMEIMKDLYSRRVQNEWVFFNSLTGTRFNRRPKMMPALCRKANIRRFGFHALRHFGATYLAHQKNIPYKTISALLRHRSLATTEAYLHSIEESQKAAVKKLEGLFCGVGCGVDRIGKKRKMAKVAHN